MSKRSNYPRFSSDPVASLRDVGFCSFTLLAASAAALFRTISSCLAIVSCRLLVCLAVASRSCLSRSRCCWSAVEGPIEAFPSMRNSKFATTEARSYLRNLHAQEGPTQTAEALFLAPL